MSDRFELDMGQVRRSFNRAVTSYDSVAELQRQVCGQLLERLDWIRLEPKVVLDVGTGTGQGVLGLKKRYPKAQHLAFDMAEQMLRSVAKRSGWFRKPGLICGDARRLPLADQSVDLLFSSLTIQWCSEDLTALFSEFVRVLRPGGLMMFTTFGPDTLHELRTAWRQVDDTVHVNEFVDMHDIGDALLASGLRDPVMDVERLPMPYANVVELMRSLKAMGAHNVATDRHRGLTGKGALKRLAEHYPVAESGEVVASYEVLFGMGWAASEAAALGRSGDQIDVPFSWHQGR